MTWSGLSIDAASVDEPLAASRVVRYIFIDCDTRTQGRDYPGERTIAPQNNKIDEEWIR